jgi:hypothetical protein
LGTRVEPQLSPELFALLQRYSLGAPVAEAERFLGALLAAVDPSSTFAPRLLPPDEFFFGSLPVPPFRGPGFVPLRSIPVFLPSLLSAGFILPRLSTGLVLQPPAGVFVVQAPPGRHFAARSCQGPCCPTA